MTQRLTKTEIATYLNIEVDAVDNLVTRGQLAAPVDHAGPWGSPRWAAADVVRTDPVEVVEASDTNLVLQVHEDGTMGCSVAGEILPVVPCAVWEYVVQRVLSFNDKMNIPPEHHRKDALQRLHEEAPVFIPVPMSVLSSNNSN